MEKFKTISQKFTLGLVNNIIVVMVLFSILLVLANFKTGEKKLKQTFEGIVNKTKVILPGALWKFNHDYIDDYIESIFINEDMVYARVRSEGKIVKEKVIPKFSNKNLLDFKKSPKFIVKEQPILYDTYTVGEVVLVMSKDRIKQQMVKESINIIAIAFINIIAIFATTFYLSRKHIFIPLKALEVSVKEISKGNLDTRVESLNDDEIGDLASAFDQMVSNLKETMASKAELEKEIHQRETAQVQSKMLATILEDSFNEIYVFDADHLKFKMVNQGARTNIGFSMKELEQMTPMEIEPDFTKDEFNQMIAPLRSGEKSLLHFLTIHQRKDLSVYPVEVYLQLMRFQPSDVFVAVILDITERMAADKKLLASVKEKEILLREIHHRVKNNMQIIQSLLNLQMGKFTNKELKKALQDSNNRIKSMALIHETLYRAEDLASLKIKDYLKQITRFLMKIYLKPESEIRIEMDVEDVKLSLDKSIACGLIINELVTNALKHAFDKKQAQGNITIIFKTISKNQIRLMVADNGKGLSDQKKTKDFESLGLKIVRMLAEDQLEGSFSVEQGEQIVFEIQFPLTSKEK